MLGPDKKRLSKRHAATSLEEYREAGYLDTAIINTLSRLGWAKGDDEVFYLDDLINNFNLSEVQKAGAIFDITKLDWLNSQHLANLSLQDFKSHLKPFLEEISIDINNHDNVDLLIESLRTSENTLKGIAESLRPYYEEVSDYNEKAIEKFLDQEGKAILIELKELLSNINDWNEDSIDKVLKKYQQENNCPVPKVNQPIRIALTGSIKSPSMGLTLSFFSKDESLNRINKLLSKIA